MKNKGFCIAILSCCLLFTGCGNETSSTEGSSEESTVSATSLTETTSEVSTSISTSETSIEESTSAEDEVTPISQTINIVPTDFFTSYGDDLIDFSGVKMNVLDILKTTKNDNEVAQFSSSKRRDAGCMTTAQPYSGIKKIVISQLETGFDGFISVSVSDDGISYEAVSDDETASAFEYSFDITGAKYFKIANASADYALYLTSIALSVD
ncbi:MAG: hypothetical protein PHW22_05120 [Bacilli bacterium]|nr:hypothetical protein [Bacilli bacterium]